MDIGLFHIDQEQIGKIHKPTEFGMCGVKNPIQYLIVSMNFLCSTLTWRKKKKTESLESLLSQQSEIPFQLYSVMPRKSLKTDTLVSIPLPGTLCNSVCVSLTL